MFFKFLHVYFDIMAPTCLRRVFCYFSVTRDVQELCGSLLCYSYIIENERKLTEKYHKLRLLHVVSMHFITEEI